MKDLPLPNDAERMDLVLCLHAWGALLFVLMCIKPSVPFCGSCRGCLLGKTEQSPSRGAGALRTVVDKPVGKKLGGGEQVQDQQQKKKKKFMGKSKGPVKKLPTVTEGDEAGAASPAEAKKAKAAKVGVQVGVTTKVPNGGAQAGGTSIKGGVHKLTAAAKAGGSALANAVQAGAQAVGAKKRRAGGEARGGSAKRQKDST